MKSTILLVILIVLSIIPCLAQDKKVTNFELEIGNRKAKYEAVIPNSLTDKFFDNKASGYQTKPQYKSIHLKINSSMDIRDLIDN